MMKAKIIVGLQFGDEGKGISTDFLCSKADNPIVIRFSGGPNCGHTVMIAGKKHVFSSYGSGSLRGVPSYFSEHCSIYLPNLDRERAVLKEKGINPELYVHSMSKIITPYDVAFNRMSEKVNQHGSVGIGIGATERRIKAGYNLNAVDLMYPDLFRAKLERIKEYYSNLQDFTGYFVQYTAEVHREEEKFNSLIEQKLFEVVDYSFLKSYQDLIFEGSQGILLDKDHGVFPNVTYANTTSKNALQICMKIGVIDIGIYYVTRCYQTRHGAGWMSNETEIKLINNDEEINKFNEHQKEFRTGEIDYKLLNYALEVDKIYSKNLQKNLIVTCLDQRPGFNFDYSKISIAKIAHELYSFNSPITQEQLIKK